MASVEDDGRGSAALVLIPVLLLGFGKGPFSHTRWNFNA